ncbi:hypothetical protein JVT61DRAFT_8942 [Boletus reticuloceps]|uniref:Uncharacterized protein n=1 Tax=Boletus reticuloceps TaxID=495285 RepID=A0A8I2YHP2_9AGAM|nr:hypothetical protein JVT61DRAFT_8942 [Boletus reticuloceps]
MPSKLWEDKAQAIFTEVLVNVDIKPSTSIRSFSSRVISKSSAVDDMYKSPIPSAKGKLDKAKHLGYIVVTKYVPVVGDSKQDINLCCGFSVGGTAYLGHGNSCRAAYSCQIDLRPGEFARLYPVLSLLSNTSKVPLVKPGTDIIHSLSGQCNALNTFLDWKATMASFETRIGKRVCTAPRREMNVLCLPSDERSRFSWRCLSS